MAKRLVVGFFYEILYKLAFGNRWDSFIHVYGIGKSGMDGYFCRGIRLTSHVVSNGLRSEYNLWCPLLENITE